MLFLDRLILARYSIEAMNAVSAAHLACGIFLFSGVAIAAIAEVYVGQYNGAQHYKKMGKPVWQMIWFSLLLFLIFLPLAKWGGFYLLPTVLHAEGLPYYQWIMAFGPLMALMSALSSFFIGQGRVRLVTISAVVANIVNLGVGIALVFGVQGFIPSMGTKGAAIAAVLSQALQVAMLAFVFLNKKNRKEFNTHQWQFDWESFMGCLKIGTPNAVSHLIEISAWAALTHIAAFIHPDCVTVRSIGNSIFLLFVFASDGLHKGVIAIASNLLGAKKEGLIKQLVWSSIKLHMIIVVFLLIPLVIFPDLLLDQFLRGSCATDDVYHQSIIALRWVWVFFIFDNVVWIMAGILTAGGDTRFIMWANVFTSWGIAIAPVYIAAKYFTMSHASIWAWMTLYGLINMLIFTARYKSERWKHTMIKA